MKLKSIQVVILLAAVSLTGLLILQVHWFHKAFQLEEKQFNEKVNLALRSVSHQILIAHGDQTSKIPPIQQIASNAFTVQLNAPFTYAHLYALLKEHFTHYGIKEDYQLTIQAAGTPEMLLGGLVQTDAPKAIPIPCLTREQINGFYQFSITFPAKGLYLTNGMQIWYGTALTFLLVLFFFCYTAIVTLREKKLSAMKRDFMNNMTHELKTPLASISLASEVLRKPDHKIDAQKTSHYAHLIYQETQRMQRQVDHVLQIARLERGDVALQMTTLDVHTLIKEVLTAIGVKVQKREGCLQSEFKAKNALVVADAHHLKNVLYNLIDNAEKYSPDKPQIKVMTHNQEDKLIIAIMDQGIGINPKVQHKIFNTFYRFQQGNVHDVKGFGLGLSYVKSIVAAHKGRIQVESKLGEGSLFRLIFHCAFI